MQHSTAAEGRVLDYCYTRISIELQHGWTESVNAKSWTTVLALVKLPALAKNVGWSVLVVCERGRQCGGLG